MTARTMETLTNRPAGPFGHIDLIGGAQNTVLRPWLSQMKKQRVQRTRRSSAQPLRRPMHSRKFSPNVAIGYITEFSTFTNS